jgi:hypothetical protein
MIYLIVYGFRNGVFQLNGETVGPLAYMPRPTLDMLLPIIIKRYRTLA